MKPALIAAAAAFCIAAATAFAMSTKAWADSAWWLKEDDRDDILFGRIDSGGGSRYGVPSQIKDYIKEQYNNSDSEYISPWRSLAEELADELIDERALGKGLPGKRP